MTTATGAFTKLALKQESTWGVAPGGNYVLVPLKSFNLSPTRAFQEDRLLGQGREARRPSRGEKMTDGTAVVPLDLRAIGYWLQSLLGDETVSGSGPYTHRWRSNVANLKSLAAETQFTNLATPVYSMATGIMVNSLRFAAQPTGLADANLGLLYEDAADATSSAAGTPSEVAVQRFFQSHSVLKKDGADLLKVTNLDFTYDNGLAAQRYVGAGGAVGDIDVGGASCRGTLTARFVDQALLGLANNETLFDLRVGFERSGSESLIFEVEQCELVLTGREASGPGGIDLRFAWNGSKDLSEGQMLTVTLINDVASY